MKPLFVNRSRFTRNRTFELDRFELDHGGAEANAFELDRAGAEAKANRAGAEGAEANAEAKYLAIVSTTCSFAQPVANLILEYACFR